MIHTIQSIPQTRSRPKCGKLVQKICRQPTVNVICHQHVAECKSKKVGNMKESFIAVAKYESYLLSPTSASGSGLLAKPKASLRSRGLSPRCWFGKGLEGKEEEGAKEGWEGKEANPAGLSLPGCK